jgi:hypothetical protein
VSEAMRARRVNRWPRYDEAAAAAAGRGLAALMAGGAGRNLRLDMCNISVEVAWKQDVCRHWERWLPSGSAAHRRASATLR